MSQVRAQILKATEDLLASPAASGWAKKPLLQLNQEAAFHQKAGRPLSAIAAYSLLFRKVKEQNLVHPELYVCHTNRACTYLKLGLFDEALLDAERARQLAEAALRK